MSAAAAMRHPGHAALRAPLLSRHHPRRATAALDHRGRRGARALTSPLAKHIHENFERNAYPA